MQHGEFNAETDDYEAFVAQRRQRFKRIVGGIVLFLLLFLHVPWAFAAAHLIRPNVAETMSCVSGLLLLAAWRGLLTKLGDPDDGSEPTPEGRRRHLADLLGATAGIIGTVLVLGIASCVAGWIGKQGMVDTVLFAFMLAAAVGQRLFWRAVRHGR